MVISVVDLPNGTSYVTNWDCKNDIDITTKANKLRHFNKNGLRIHKTKGQQVNILNNSTNMGNGVALQITWSKR